MADKFDLGGYLNRTNESYARIVDRAAKLFRQRGFSAVSMNEIARSVGLSKAGLYHHCPSKERLLQDIFLLAGALLMRQLDLAESAKVTKAGRLKRFVVTRMEVVTEYQDFFTIVWQERTYVDGQAFEELREISELYRARVRALIEGAQESGEISGEIDPHLLMLAIDGMTGWAYLWFDDNGRLSATEVGLAFWSILENGILRKAD